MNASPGSKTPSSPRHRHREYGQTKHAFKA
jgi:hypothetical protein